MTTPRRGPVRPAPLFADALRMPGDIARGVRSLPAGFRTFRQLQRERGAILPLLAYRIDPRIRGPRARFGREGPQNFSTLLEASAYDEAGLSYRLPDHVHDERSSKW